jgi:hypothetical protein
LLAANNGARADAAGAKAIGAMTANNRADAAAFSSFAGIRM